MCDTYVDTVGYICHDCQDEFERFLKAQGIDELSEIKMIEKLQEFMNTRKYNGENRIMKTREFFKKHTS